MMLKKLENNSKTTFVTVNPITSITMAKCQKYSKTTFVTVNLLLK